MALSNKQQAFIDSYLRHWNATRAAIEAGYSKRTARAIGAENLTKPDISKEIAARKAALIMSADEVLTRLTDMGRGSLADFADVKTSEDLKKHPRSHLVHKLETRAKKTKDGDTLVWIKIELHNSQHALTTLAKITGILSDQHVITVKMEKELSILLDTAERVLPREQFLALLDALADAS